MQLHPFRDFMEKYCRPTDLEWEHIEQCLTRKEYVAESILLEEGKVCRKLYFLESGFLRYFSNQNGEESTKYFTIAPYCFTSQRSLNTGAPATDSIQVLEDSIIWEMNKSDVEALNQYPSWNSFARTLVQEVQFYTENILLALQNETAENRYKQMVKDNSIILQKAPLKHIASYLGIAPQSLSRIRKKYADQMRS